MEQRMDFCNLWLTEDEKGVTSDGRDKSGIQNCLGLSEAVYEIRRMTLTRSRSDTGRCECEKTGGKSQPRKEKQGRDDHGVRGDHGLNREKKQDENQKTWSGA